MKKKNKATKGRPRVSRRTKPMRMRVRSSSSPVSTYAHMVADPCHGPLERAFGAIPGGSIAERLRASITLPATAAENNGYVVVFPSYHGSNLNAACGSFYYFTTTNTTVRPVNTVAAPMGTGGVCGTFLLDPANSLIVGGTAFGRAKTLSACLQAEWLSSLSSIQGQVAVVANLPLNVFNATPTAALMSPISVEEIFNYAAVRERFQIEGHEAVWRPSQDESVFRTTEADEILTTQSSLPDAAFWTGTAASAATKIVATSPNDVLGMCIAWRGTAVASNSIGINLVKSVDLELTARGNSIEAVPRATDTSPGLNLVSKAVEYLDKTVPSWQTRAVTAMGRSLLSKVFAPKVGFRASAEIYARPMRPPPIEYVPYSSYPPGYRGRLKG